MTAPCEGAVRLWPMARLLAESEFLPLERARALVALKQALCRCEGPICDRWQADVMAGQHPERPEP